MFTASQQAQESCRARLGAERWNFLLSTPQGIATPRRELLKGAVTVVVEGAIVWCKQNRADVWSTSRFVSEVKGFPPGLSVWGDPASALAFHAKGIPFVPMKPNAILGPGLVPRPADAFFKALAFACENLKAKKVRVFGLSGLQRCESRWKRWSFARLQREAGALGIELERVR